MKSGIELIAIERQEQIEKHGRTTEKDVANNSDNQLIHGADALISRDWTYFGNPPAKDEEFGCPEGWDWDIWRKMFNKSYKERLIIAGALIAAEIDRIQSLEK